MSISAPARTVRPRVRPEIAIMAFLLLLSACAGEVPAEQQGAASQPSAPLTSGATPGSVQTGNQAVAAAVRAYFEADGDRDWRRMAALSVGPIHALWTWYDAELGSCNCPVEELSLHRIRVVRVIANHATVDLWATLTASDHVTVFTGPMTLVKAGAGWKVKDYRRNGVPFAETVSARAATASASGLTVSVLGTERVLDGEVVWLQIMNLRSADVAVAAWTASVGATDLTPAIYRSNISDILAGHQMVTDFEWSGTRPMVAGRPLHLGLVFRDLQTNKRISISLDALS